MACRESKIGFYIGCYHSSGLCEGGGCADLVEDYRVDSLDLVPEFLVGFDNVKALDSFGGADDTLVASLSIFQRYLFERTQASIKLRKCQALVVICQVAHPLIWGTKQVFPLNCGPPFLTREFVRERIKKKEKKTDLDFVGNLSLSLR